MVPGSQKWISKSTDVQASLVKCHSWLNSRKRNLWMRRASCIYYTIYVSAYMLSCVQLFGTPWTVARQASLFIRFTRQEYWSGLPFPSPGDLPDPGIEPVSPALAGRLSTTVPPGKQPRYILNLTYCFERAIS